MVLTQTRALLTRVESSPCLPSRSSAAGPSARVIRGSSVQSRQSAQNSLYDTTDPTSVRQRLFGDIAPIYDELNERLSLGQHKVWKRMAVKWSRARTGSKCLDVCCGSGDLAFLLAQASGPTGQVVALDFAQEMLQYAEEREAATAQAGRSTIEWVLGDATRLPFQDGSFDAATMGYGLRNVADIPGALGELRRVLRPKSWVSILDFNNASQSSPVIDFIQGWALENVVVPAARNYGLENEYRYLRPSIQAFPSGKEQEALARNAGFRKAVHHEIGFGLMGCLVAQA